jgi:hypothetical protein
MSPTFSIFLRAVHLSRPATNLNAHGIEITMTLAILFGLFMLWTFWFVVAH